MSPEMTTLQMSLSQSQLTPLPKKVYDKDWKVENEQQLRQEIREADLERVQTLTCLFILFAQLWASCSVLPNNKNLVLGVLSLAIFRSLLLSIRVTCAFHSLICCLVHLITSCVLHISRILFVYPSISV